MPFTPDSPSPPSGVTSGFKPDPIIPDAADKAAAPRHGFINHIETAAEKLMPKNYGVPAAFNQVASPQGTQQLATTLIPGSASAMSEGMGALGRIGTAGLAGGGAAVGVQDPNQSNIDKLSYFLKGGALGAGLQGAGEVASSIGNSVSDMLMKKATGIRKAPEGIGTNLVKQGVWGTKAGMLDQVGDKLQSEEQNLQELVGQLKGNIDPKEIADVISKKSEKFISPSGITLDSLQPDLNKVRSAADQFGNRLEGITPQDLLSLKRQGDWAGYTASGNPAAATDSEIGRAIADKSRSLLSEMSSGNTADTLKREQALVYAKKALEKDPTTHMGLGSALIYGKLPGQDLLMSTGAQAIDKLSGLAGTPLKDPRLQRALEQGLFEK